MKAEIVERKVGRGINTKVKHSVIVRPNKGDIHAPNDPERASVFDRVGHGMEFFCKGKHYAMTLAAALDSCATDFTLGQFGTVEEPKELNYEESKSLKEEIKGYPKGTAIIRYRYDGTVKDLAIEADPESDTEDTLRRHLARHISGAIFLGFIIH